MKLSSNSITLILLTMTAVQAIPTPMKSPFKSGSFFKLGSRKTKQGVPAAAGTVAAGTVAAGTVAAGTVAALPAEQALRAVSAVPVEQGIGAGSVASQSLDQVNAKAAARSERQVDLDLDLAKLNAMKAESELKKIPMKLDKVDENWRKIIFEPRLG
jgi:hypothetical protein